MAVGPWESQSPSTTLQDWSPIQSDGGQGSRENPDNSWAIEQKRSECHNETSFKDLLYPIGFLTSLGNFSGKDQILNLLGFMDHSVSLPQLLNSAFVAREQPSSKKWAQLRSSKTLFKKTQKTKQNTAARFSRWTVYQPLRQNRILRSRNNPQKARGPQRDHQPQPLAGARLPKRLLCVAPKDSASRHSSPIWTHQTHTRQHSESKEPTFTFLWSLIAGLWCFHQPVSNLVWWFNPNVDSTFEWGTQEDRAWEGQRGILNIIIPFLLWS